MAEQSGFFDAHLLNGEYDRVYLAEHFARYFASFIGNGIFGGKSNELMVRQKETADMSVRVLAGQGFINGYFYENTDELSLAIGAADGVLNRIDLIVLRWDKYERNIHLAVERGTLASSPSVPSLKRNSDFYDLELAKVYVKAGATRITQADITDTRLDSSVCGFVVGVVDNFDTTEFNAQLNAWIEQFKADSHGKINALVNELMEIVEAGDLSPILTEIQNLNSRSAFESEEYPGCFYRIVNGEVEWLNPPDEYGVEYRLAERCKGRPVFKETIFIPSLPSNSYAYVNFTAYIEETLSIYGYAHFPDDAATYPFPVYMERDTTPAALIHRVELAPESLDYTGSVGIQTTSERMSDFSAVITVKYLKHGF